MSKALSIHSSTRRKFISLSGAAMVAGPGRAAAASKDAFLQALAAFQTDAGLATSIRSNNEIALLFKTGFERAPIRTPKSTTPISRRASDLIVACEITNAKVYTARYQAPTWPQGDSGVTIGVGYDVGYVSKQELKEDWAAYIDSKKVDALLAACKITGTYARDIAKKLHDATVPWNAASAQYNAEICPRYVGVVEASLPNTRQLNADCLGALVSLVYNRGASFSLKGDRYTEMRAIKQHMAAREFRKIPAELRSMKRIWQGQANMRGVVLRRDAEAGLFELGLNTR